MYFGLFPVIEAILLLVLMFFVLFASSKTDSKPLRQFGRTLSIIICALAVLLVILNIISGWQKLWL